MIQLVDQVRIKLVSQWIKDISRTEVRLNQAKYYPNSVLRLICHENMQTNKYNNDFGFSNCKECTDSLNYKSSRPDVFCQKGFLEISQKSQENTCARVSFLIKLQVAPATLLKKRLWHRFFPVNVAKFPRTPFSQNTSGRLLLYVL